MQRAPGEGSDCSVPASPFDKAAYLFALQCTRVPMTLTAILTGLPAGSYQVGLCGTTSQAANWNSNEYSYTTAMVLE